MRTPWTDFIALGILVMTLFGCPRSVPSTWLALVDAETLPDEGATKAEAEEDLPMSPAPSCPGASCAGGFDCEGPASTCHEDRCIEGCCVVVQVDVGTECDLPCHHLAVCSNSGECKGIVKVLCPDVDADPCTAPHCLPETGNCAGWELPLPDGTVVEDSPTNCWQEVTCVAGEIVPDESVPSLLSQQCQQLDVQKWSLGCDAAVTCDEMLSACVTEAQADGHACLPEVLPEIADVCPGFACQAGQCVGAPSLDRECTASDYPAWCGNACQQCTTLGCQWLEVSSADGGLQHQCTPEVLQGDSCEDGEPCTLGDTCADGEVVEVPGGQEVWGTCLGGPTGMDDSIPDLVIDGETLVLSGSHTFAKVTLVNGAVLKVQSFDGEPCEPETGSAGTGTLKLEAVSIYIDATSMVDARAAGGGGEACGQPNSYYVNDSGAGGGYGGSGGWGAVSLIQPGGVYGSEGGLDIAMGSNGSTIVVAGSGCGPLGPSDGGVGGGLISLSCCSLHLDGKLLADGGKGEDGGPDHDLDGAGGGSGGGIFIASDIFVHKGVLSARGGAGGDGMYQGSCNGWGGGGGGGGRIKVFAGEGANSGAVDVKGGAAGYKDSPTAGQSGTAHLEFGN